MDRLKRARAAAGLKSLAARFLRQTQGNVAMMFAMALPVLLMITLGAIDIHQASKVKAQLQDALDAAALAAARSTFTDDVNINKVGLAALKANMPGYFDKEGDTASFVLIDNRRVEADAKVDVKVLVANVFLPPYGKLLDDYLPVGVSSEVVRASRNVEVALVLDITGSMSGSPLASLKEAAKDLVGLVVQEQQSPFTSRVALVPYSMGVNLGDYADSVRGPLKDTTAISAADWADASRSLSRVSSGVLTANSHGLKAGEYVWISGVSNASSGLNNRIHRVSSVTADTFQLDGFFGSGSRNTGSFRRCWSSDCRVWVTSAQHTLSTGDWVRISGVQGMSGLNAYFQATKISDDQFSVDLSGPGQSPYSRGGAVQCGYDGCRTRYYIGRDNSTLRELPSSTCVSERLWISRNSVGKLVPTDRTPLRTKERDDWVGRNYPHSNNRCLSNTLTPLSSQVETKNGVTGLNSLIDGYQAAGSTAGQIGIEWGWYAVSPNFNTVWPSASSANPYDTSKTLKAVVLMTDGEFNNPYCQGVISRDAPSNGSAGNASYQINCSAPNGSPFAQSVALCEGMKKENIVIYTVGFNLSTSTGGSGVDTAYEVMEQCATSKEHFFKPNQNTDLKEAFRAIGRDITRLRIAR
ncbi:ubiquitin-activating E1 FCCH domain-containing protein [Brevundimonas diminuta]|jgi:Flp pilus assembly protein TadG|uniref:ubiquitin-activating E1 FCCH domain-containing protein n=1 Tax=Brevundimonas diminuta TaxID=293 RepID=UPI0035D6C082